MSRFRLWSGVLGFALGGFFDGILLHQTLQWHHLLSLVDGVGGLRTQIFWDGAFHVLMYLVALVALVGLWRACMRGGRLSARQVVGWLLVGFAAWQAVDVGVFHWLLGIHRVRVDTANPLAWDLGWFAAFGAVPLAVALAMLRGRRPPGRMPASVLALALSAGTVTFGAWSLRQPPSQPFTTVVFPAQMSEERKAAVLRAVGAQIVWSYREEGVAVVLGPPQMAWGLYRRGVLLVSGAGLPPGCASWSRV